MTPSTVPSEYTEQCQVFAWAAAVAVEFPDLAWLHASLNGVKLPIGLAVKMKAAGMTAGVPDLSLPVVRFRPDGLGIWPGLYIEMKKRRGGRVDPDQQRWIAHLTRQGYAVHVASGADDAEVVLLRYLGADDATIRRLVPAGGETTGRMPTACLRSF